MIGVRNKDNSIAGATQLNVELSEGQSDEVVCNLKTHAVVTNTELAGCFTFAKTVVKTMTLIRLFAHAKPLSFFHYFSVNRGV